MELNRLVRVRELDVALTSLISRTVESVWNSKELADILLLISYADATEGHYGGVYQAASWNYAGIRKSATTGVRIDGVEYHARSANAKWGTSSVKALRKKMPGRKIERVENVGMFVYWKPKPGPRARAAARLAKKLGLESLPYPQRLDAAELSLKQAAEKLASFYKTMAAQIEAAGDPEYAQLVEMAEAALEGIGSEMGPANKDLLVAALANSVPYTDRATVWGSSHPEGRTVTVLLYDPMA